MTVSPSPYHFGVFVHHALNELWQSSVGVARDGTDPGPDDFTGCCPKCCGPCSVLQELRSAGSLDLAVLGWPDMLPGTAWWDEDRQEVCREWLDSAWAHRQCCERTEPGSLTSLALREVTNCQHPQTNPQTMTGDLDDAARDDTYEIQLREAVLEAEAGDDGTPERRAYAMGLRVAAGLYGLPEGVDPATRTRWAHDTTIIDLSDDRRDKKPWLPEDDRDVTGYLVVQDQHGLPECVLHGAMNRVDPVRRIYRCSEMRCGVGAEVVSS